MEDKYQGIYRIKSARMPNWNYGWKGSYFVTICTQGREFYFGDIVGNRMKLSEIGEIAESEWLKSPEFRPDMNLEMDEFVIMPNHLHGIITIGKNEYNEFNDGHRDAMHGDSSITPTTKSGPQRNNLSSIIRGFKSAVTINARKFHVDFAWQSRFHDHIIRNEESLNNIRNYIRNNPLNWTNDSSNHENTDD